LELHPPDFRARALASGTAAGAGVQHHASGGRKRLFMGGNLLAGIASADTHEILRV
jgi:hypothetical protein